MATEPVMYQIHVVLKMLGEGNLEWVNILSYQIPELRGNCWFLVDCDKQYHYLIPNENVTMIRFTKLTGNK